MENIKLFIQLTRLNKPIGSMLLFWPCIWGLTIAYNFNSSLNNFFFYGILFFLGSVLMRSAGCIVNDIADKNFDKKVERTKNRPIASEKVSVRIAILYVLILCALALLVLINFNHFTILMALISIPLAFTYPLMKRFTYWPQLFLGITFNYGLRVSFGNSSGALDPINVTKVLQPKGLYFVRPSMQQYLRNSEELNEAANMLFEKISSGKIKVEIYKKYKLDEVEKAHQDLEGRKIIGPAVIIP